LNKHTAEAASKPASHARAASDERDFYSLKAQIKYKSYYLKNSDQYLETATINAPEGLNP